MPTKNKGRTDGGECPFYEPAKTGEIQPLNRWAAGAYN
jgi:hypothetical protein